MNPKMAQTLVALVEKSSPLHVVGTCPEHDPNGYLVLDYPIISHLVLYLTMKFEIPSKGHTGIFICTQTHLHVLTYILCIRSIGSAPNVS